MNLYIRYFDNETLVPSVNDAIDFLASIPEIELPDDFEEELTEYYESDAYFPKRFKVRARVYFIVIKTEAETLIDFKEKKALRRDGTSELESPFVALNTQRFGWYEGTLDFKRVVVNHLGKCEYRDTVFTARCKAASPSDCYNRIREYLESRVDSRSQFPSVKGKNFKYVYLGACKNDE